MNPNAAEISHTLKVIRDSMGVQVFYRGGHWFTKDRAGADQPVNPANAAAFDDVLQQTMLNMRAARKPAAPASTPGASPASAPSGSTPSFWQRAVSGVGAARVGGSILSIGARIGGALGAGGPVGAVMGIGGMALGAVTQVVGGVIRTIIGVVSTGFSLAFRLISGIISTGLALVRTIITTAVTGLVAVFGVFVAAVVKARDTLTATARSINGLSAATGLGTQRSGRLINQFNAFGVNPEATASMFENSNPLTQMLRARMMGARSFDAPGAIPQMAQHFQSLSASGPFGNRIARSMLGTMDTPEMRRVLSTPVPMLREQERFQGQIQGSLGVNPGVIAAVGQQTDLLTNKFRLLGETGLTFLASRVLPYLNQKLDQAANFIAANGDRIARFITGAVDFFINGAEKVFNFFSQNGPAIGNGIAVGLNVITNAVGTAVDFLVRNGPAIGQAVQSGAQMAWGAFMNIAQWLYATAPKLVLGGLSSIVGGLASFTGYVADFLRGVQAGSSGFNELVKNVLVGASYLAGIGVFVGNVIKGIYNAFVFSWNDFGSRVAIMIYDGLLGIAKVIANSPLMAAADAVAKRMGVPSLRDAVNNASFANPFDNKNLKLPYAQMGDVDAAMNGPASLWKRFEKLRSGEGMTNAINLMDRITGNLKGYQRNIDSTNDALGSTDQRKQDFNNWAAMLTQPAKGQQATQGEQTQLLKQLVDYARLTAQNTGNTADNMMNFAADIAARTTAYQVQDAAMNIMRT